MGQGSFKSYTTGFAISVVLTLGAFLVVSSHALSQPAMFTRTWVVSLIVILALAQFAAQLMLFLHLGEEPKPRWNSIIFSFMIMVVVIIVFGSLWIMANLNYHTMSPADTSRYLMHEEGIHK